MPLRPAISTVALQTLRNAFEDLNRTIVPADSLEFSVTTLEHVRKAALDIENQLAARQSLRNMRRLMPLFKGLEHYGRSVDVLCNGTPYLSWIWAPITLILRVASEYVEAFEQIVKGYARIGESLGRFSVLGDAFSKNPSFQQTLAVFYADILLFHKHAYKFVRRNGWRLIFVTSWGRFQRRFDNILEDMKRHEQLIDQEANAHNIAEARQMRQDILAWREESIEQVERYEREQAEKQYQSIKLWLKMDESDQLAIFDSISREVDVCNGTTEWILNNAIVRSWLRRKPDPPFVWLQGVPGSGKSVISTRLVRFLEAAKSTVIHHFCTFSYSSSIKYEQILQWLLLQLLRKNGELVAHVYEQYVLGKKSPAISTLEHLLQTVIDNMSGDPYQVEYIWIIVDGLHECETEKQARLISLMNQITSNRCLPRGIACKVLLSGRMSQNIPKRLWRRPIVNLSDEKDHLKEAIKQYALFRLQSFCHKFSSLGLGSHTVNEIGDTIAEKADGMFLYARLVLDYLATNIFFSGDEITQSIQQLPPTLNEFYQKILTRSLICLDSRSIDRVKCLLGWVAFAKRPLKKLELLSAISFSSRNSEITHIAPAYMLEICGCLVEERRDMTMAFIHGSVREFLQTASTNVVIEEQTSLKEHGEATITCLLSGLDVFCDAYPKHARCLRVVRGLHGLHVYATEYWTEYILSYAASTKDFQASSEFSALACRLANKLNRAAPPTSSVELSIESSVSDKRLMLLQEHTELKKQVEEALKARSLKRLESELLEERDPYGGPRHSQHRVPIEGISVMLRSYQETIESLLDQDSYPGVSIDDLEVFKSQFRTSAYTCRVGSCPRATLGFKSEHLLYEHEVAHLRQLRCTFPDCQYPSFRSAQHLKNHIRKHHTPTPSQRSIRRVLKFPRGQLENDMKVRPSVEAQDVSPSAPKLDPIFDENGFRLDSSGLENFDFDSFLRTDESNNNTWDLLSKKFQGSLKSNSEEDEVLI